MIYCYKFHDAALLFTKLKKVFSTELYVLVAVQNVREGLIKLTILVFKSGPFYFSRALVLYLNLSAMKYEVIINLLCF